MEESLLNPNQSGFRPGDSCINQLLAITHELFEAFDCNPPLEVQRNIFNIFDPKGIKFLTRLRLGFSHLNEHRFRHNFQDCMNPLCSCSLEIEDTLHYLLHCHHFNHICIDLMNSVKSVSDNFESLSDKDKKIYTFIW